jgi:hypothetical protein
MIEPQLRMTINDVMHVYAPREDITVYELAKLHQLITVSVSSPMKPVDRDAYVEKYGLLRHFVVAI